MTALEGRTWDLENTPRTALRALPVLRTCRNRCWSAERGTTAGAPARAAVGRAHATAWDTVPCRRSAAGAATGHARCAWLRSRVKNSWGRSPTCQPLAGRRPAPRFGTASYSAPLRARLGYVASGETNGPPKA